MNRLLFAFSLAAACSSAALAAPTPRLPPETQAWLATSPNIVVRMETLPAMGILQPIVAIRGNRFGGGFIEPTIHGTLKNGQEVAIIPLLSGGSMGVADALVFTKLGGKRKFVGDLPTPGGHLLITVSDGMIQTSVAMHEMGDSTATPSKRYITKYTLDGIRLVRVRASEESAK